MKEEEEEEERKEEGRGGRRKKKGGGGKEGRKEDKDEEEEEKGYLRIVLQQLSQDGGVEVVDKPSEAVRGVWGFIASVSTAVHALFHTVTKNKTGPVSLGKVR